jgi:hypothetical protein
MPPTVLQARRRQRVEIKSGTFSLLKGPLATTRELSLVLRQVLYCVFVRREGNNISAYTGKSEKNAPANTFNHSGKILPYATVSLFDEGVKSHPG